MASYKFARGHCLACSFCAFLGGQSSCKICESIWVKLALEKAFRQHDRKNCMNKKWENPIKMNMLGTAHPTVLDPTEVKLLVKILDRMTVNDDSNPEN